MENENYKEIKIDTMIVDGKEQNNSVISAEETKGKQELHVTIYTEGSK